MNLKRILAATVCLVMAVYGFAQMPKGSPRERVEMETGSGKITVDYGRPELKGRDMLAQLQVGDFWRMGSNQATVLTTPIDLAFGSTKLAKGSYSLFLKRTAEDKFELVFNSETGQWGLKHDPAKDVAAVPLSKETLADSVEKFTIELKGADKGGIFALSWGTTRLSTRFAFGG